MPSTILSDNGASSGTAGIKTTGSNDGILVLQTTTSGGTATAAITIDTTQRSKFPTTIGVGDATPSTSGSGITFPATQSASSDANTLDDYEEGTWTPSLGGNTTYNVQAGTYTKVGRMVVARGNVNVITIGTGSTGIVTGLPFTTATIFGVQVGYWGLTANNFVFIGGFSNSSTQIDFYTATAATGTLGNGTAIFGNGTNLHFTITYFI